ncbi:MAG: hypothetical protein IT290_07510 [Deltaproteobacteria bacterium]|nr:hypothetical protein [Deltaproteobacteria bacterium]
MRSRYLRALCSFLPIFFASVASADITLNPGTTYQTFDGWEGTGQMAQGSPRYSLFKDEITDRLVNELGITRVRLEVNPAIENTVDYQQQYLNGQITRQEWKCRNFSTVNDNSDPNSLNPAGFIWRLLDEKIDSVIIPLRQRVAANGEAFWTNLTYVAFTDIWNNCGGLGLTNAHTNPQEYAEFMLAIFQHMQSKYGFVPDSVELYLEPDNVTIPISWNGTQLGQVLVATQAKLSANGFNPKYVAPSTMNMSTAVTYFDQLAAVPGALQHVSEISYHRYTGVSLSALQQIASRAVQHNKRTSQLEFIGASYENLHEDLTVGRNSTWAQFTLAYSECAEAPQFPCGNYSNPPSASDDIGGNYYLIDDSSTNYTIYMGSRTKLLRQYMKFIRPGAVRIAASTTQSNLDPVAFINPGGKYVVVVKAHNVGSPIVVNNLPAGTYGRSYATLSGNPVTLSDVTISAGQSVTIPGLPEWGVATVHAKTGGTTFSPCDLNSSGSTDIVDVQLSANQVLNVIPCSNGDINQNGSCGVDDVQRVINAALNLTCVTQ